MSDKDAAMQQALEALIDAANVLSAPMFAAAVDALKAALEQPVQKPVACRFCHSEKGCWTWQCYHCGEIDDVQKPAPPPVQEPVSIRMPKVGDKVICIEDESLGEVVSLTAGGSPDILFDDGSHGTYLLHEFAELFGYVASPLPVQPEPVTWDKPSDNFNDWWDGDRRRDNPFEKDTPAYWAYEGWQAALAQRQWVGLAVEEIEAIGDRVANEQLVGPVSNFRVRLAQAIEQTLKERNG